VKKVTLAALLLAGCIFEPVYGQLFVTDQAQNEILKFDSPGTGTVFVPSGQTWSPLQPTGLTFGPDGNLYVVGTGNGEVLRFNGTTGAPDGQPQPLLQNSIFTTGPAFSDAQGIAFGADGNIYVTNDNNVSQFNGTTGVFMHKFTLLSNNPNSNPFFAGITLGPDGKLYVADQNGSQSDSFGDSILRLDPTNLLNPFSTFVPSNTDGMEGPTGVTFGLDGNLYVASPATLRASGGIVRRFSGTTGAFIDEFVSPVAANNGGLNFPNGLVFGPDRNLYVGSSFHAPPINPVDSFVGRYNGSTGAFIDYFGQANSTAESFFGVAFPTLTAIPEAGTFAIGGAISLALVFHFFSRKRNRKSA
jgi:outer membrane protein assembly factor BamB